ncbi:MAG: flagellar biosynthetic protein FliQ [Candidatus Eremiobacteraeota bacterium]|nr:flagellar biosynthetic protein FliQ [Candidatus Eremiobacteraeota bacterium]
MDAFDQLLHEALIVAAILCLPVLSLATLVGALVAIVQAATQIQEQTLSLLPKLFAVGLTLAVFGPFGMHLCAGLFSEALQQIPAIVRQ